MIEIAALEYRHCEKVYEIARDSLPEHWSLEGIKDVLNYNNNIYYVAVNKSDNDVVGFGGIMIVADEAELLNIAVAEQFRRQGIANDLVDRLLAAACNSNCSRMLLEVRKANAAARHLYMQKGFTELGVRNNYYSNPSDDAIIMEKHIGSIIQ